VEVAMPAFATTSLGSASCWRLVSRADGRVRLGAWAAHGDARSRLVVWVRVRSEVVAGSGGELALRHASGRIAEGVVARWNGPRRVGGSLSRRVRCGPSDGVLWAMVPLLRDAARGSWAHGFGIDLTHSPCG
jgi:hypothetical protein